jgi:DNA polymerase-4
LHCDLDAFFVAVEQARDPALRGKAVIVGGEPGGRGVVSTASYEARKFGVYSGMSIGEASRLAPQAIFVRGDYREYSRVSGEFHRILADYTPLVESGGLDEAYLDITGCEHLIGQPIEAAASIRARVRDELGLVVSVGCAASKVVAKTASDAAKPDGVLEIPEGGEMAFLAPLPLRALPMLGKSAENRLNEVGITLIGQVQALSDQALVGLFGPHGPALGARARGSDPSHVYGGDPQKSISREGTFSHDVASPAYLRAVLRSFSESVGVQLRGQQKRARTVSLKLRYDDFTTVSRSHSPKRPVESNEAIYNAAHALLTTLRAGDTRPVRLLGVGVSNLVDSAVQLTLEPSKDERLDKLSRTFDKVREKYGRRSLETGRTAFSTATSDDRVFEKATGLSAEIK